MSAPSPTDLELVRGLHARDRRALARVYGDHHAAIYNLCARILGDREEAKDVTQEVFLKALTTPPPAREDVRLRPWLFRVATNACLNLIRARRSGGGDIDTVAASHDPYEQARQAALIETSLASINERYRAALVLKDLHGLAGGELADVLEVTRPTADVLVHRARSAFRKTFTRLAGDDAVAPANLALALPALAVPAALQGLPAGLAQLAAGPAAATAASAAAPAAGVLAKIAGALTSKAAVVVAGATLVAGGGIAAVELTGGGAALAPASRPAPSAGLTDGAAIDVPSSPRDAWAGHRRAVGEHARDHGAGDHGTGHDGSHAAGHDGDGGAGHDGSHAQAGTGDHSGSGSGGHGGTTSEPAGHDAAAGGSGTTSSTSTSTATSGGHEGGGGDHGDGHD